MRNTRATAITAIAAATAAFVATVPSGAATAPTTPSAIARFADAKPNPYFPLRPGTVMRYRGSADGQSLKEKVTITHHTKVIEGVATTVVRDVLRRSGGSIAEKTHDWYATDSEGNVWYFGEKTATFDRHGHVTSRDGSWEAGVDGAVRGIVMPADPGPTDAFRQEFYRGQAEDQAWIVEGDFSTTVPLGTLHHVLRSFEWTRLERDVMSMKFYARGLGLVQEQDIAGGDEVFKLVSVVRH